jgi:hypothetical protein
MTKTINCFLEQLTDVCNTRRCEELGLVKRKDRRVRQRRKISSVGYLQHCFRVRHDILRDTPQISVRIAGVAAGNQTGFLNSYTYLFYLPIPVAAPSKASVCGRSPAEIVGRNINGGMDVCCECCVVK